MVAGDKVTQCAERILNEIAKDIKETFAGFKIKLHEVRMNFVKNPRFKGMEFTT